MLSASSHGGTSTWSPVPNDQTQPRAALLHVSGVITQEKLEPRGNLFLGSSEPLGLRRRRLRLRFRLRSRGGDGDGPPKSSARREADIKGPLPPFSFPPSFSFPLPKKPSGDRIKSHVELPRARPCPCPGRIEPLEVTSTLPCARARLVALGHKGAIFHLSQLHLQKPRALKASDLWLPGPGGFRALSRVCKQRRTGLKQLTTSHRATQESWRCSWNH